MNDAMASVNAERAIKVLIDALVSSDWYMESKHDAVDAMALVAPRDDLIDYVYKKKTTEKFYSISLYVGFSLALPNVSIDDVYSRMLKNARVIWKTILGSIDKKMDSSVRGTVDLEESVLQYWSARLLWRVVVAFTDWFIDILDKKAPNDPFDKSKVFSAFENYFGGLILSNLQRPKPKPKPKILISPNKQNLKTKTIRLPKMKTNTSPKQTTMVQENSIDNEDLDALASLFSQSGAKFSKLAAFGYNRVLGDETKTEGKERDFIKSKQYAQATLSELEKLFDQNKSDTIEYFQATMLGPAESKLKQASDRLVEQVVEADAREVVLLADLEGGIFAEALATALDTLRTPSETSVDDVETQAIRSALAFTVDYKKDSREITDALELVLDVYGDDTQWASFSRTKKLVEYYFEPVRRLVSPSTDVAVVDFVYAYDNPKVIQKIEESGQYYTQKVTEWPGSTIERMDALSLVAEQQWPGRTEGDTIFYINDDKQHRPPFGASYVSIHASRVLGKPRQQLVVRVARVSPNAIKRAEKAMEPWQPVLELYKVLAERKIVRKFKSYPLAWK